MSRNPLLHLILLVFVLLMLYVIYKVGTMPPAEPVATPLVAIQPLPKRKTALPVRPAPPTRLGPFQFPVIEGKPYVRIPFVWDDRVPVETNLAAGPKYEAQADPGPMPDKQIAPAPQVVRFRWIFALP